MSVDQASRVYSVERGRKRQPKSKQIPKPRPTNDYFLPCVPKKRNSPPRAGQRYPFIRSRTCAHVQLLLSSRMSSFIHANASLTPADIGSTSSHRHIIPRKHSSTAAAAQVCTQSQPVMPVIDAQYHALPHCHSHCYCHSHTVPM